MSTTKPATTGTCGVIGCDNAADLETQSRIGSTWTVHLACLDHASPEALAALEAGMAGR